MVIGGGPSGVDIAVDIATAAAHVYVSKRKPAPVPHHSTNSQAAIRAPMEKGPQPSNVATVGEIDHVEGGRLVMKDGAFLEGVDYIVCCTGYGYTMPFLPDVDVVGDKKVHPLYYQLFHAVHPTLAVVGLLWKNLPFPTFEYQSECLAAVYSGAAALPSKAERMASLAEFEAEKRARDEPLRYWHMIGNRQWQYCAELRTLAGLSNDLPPGVRPDSGSGSGSGSSPADAGVDHGNEKLPSALPAVPWRRDAELYARYDALATAYPMLKLMVDEQVYKDVYHARRVDPQAYRGREYVLLGGDDGDALPTVGCHWTVK